MNFVVFPSSNNQRRFLCLSVQRILFLHMFIFHFTNVWSKKKKVAVNKSFNPQRIIYLQFQNRSDSMQGNAQKFYFDAIRSRQGISFKLNDNSKQNLYRIFIIIKTHNMTSKTIGLIEFFPNTSRF